MDKYNFHRRRFLVIAIGLLAVYLGLIGFALGASDSESPKNIIILMADGMGAPQLELAEYTSHQLRGRPYLITDTFFKEGVVGLMTTHPHEASITDSAAAGSAMSTGVKTTIGTIALTPDGKPVRTAMEVAKARGKRIGLGTTSTVYDATPAAFSVHARTRWDSQALVDQYLALEPDVILGGGSDYFLPAGAPGGRRNDGLDLIAAFRAKGYQVVRNTQELSGATGPRLLGLFAEKEMGFEIDRDTGQEPSIAEMAETALRVLSRESPNGFVLLLETENTDTAGHRNDIAALIGDLWAFDRAVQLVREFQRKAPSETLVIVAGDHETGGLRLKYSVKGVRHTTTRNALYAGPAHMEMFHRIARAIARTAAALGKPTAAEAMDRAIAERFSGFHPITDQSVLAHRPPRQLEFSWSTSGHTPQPVLVAALGPGAEPFQGLLDNTDFGKILHYLIEAR